MKKQLFILALIAILAIAWYCGRANGIAHAIADSTMWLSEADTPASCDFQIEIDLDGQMYLHEGFIG